MTLIIITIYKVNRFNKYYAKYSVNKMVAKYFLLRAMMISIRFLIFRRLCFLVMNTNNILMYIYLWFDFSNTDMIQGITNDYINLFEIYLPI